MSQPSACLTENIELFEFLQPSPTFVSQGGGGVDSADDIIESIRR